MSIAFLIHSHKALDQIARLCTAIDNGLTDKFVAISHNGTREERDRIATFQGVNRVVPAVGGRSQFGLIDGLLSELRRLERERHPYEWFVVLSGQDYPIRPLHDMAEELSASEYDGYFHHFDTTQPRSIPAHLINWPDHEVDTRFHFRHTLLKRDTPRWLRAAVSLPRRALNTSNSYRIHTGFGLTFGHRASETPFSPSFRLFGGNAWMTIRRTAADAILRFIDDRPDITNYFRRVVTPDEVFLQTILANQPSLKLSNSELRYYDCTAAFLGQMKTFGADDLPGVLASGCYFARKFDIDRDPGIFDVIDEHVARTSSRTASNNAALPDPGEPLEAGLLR
ncbi:MAG: beta-1,6-N-acetylglucosaminyltransferase [Hyphomicrobiaceae bacterium]